MALEVTTDEGLDAMPSVNRETANLNMASMNFEVFLPLKKFSERKYGPRQGFLSRARAS